MFTRLLLGASASASSNQQGCVNEKVGQAADDFCVGDILIQIRTAGSSGTAVAFGFISNSDANLSVSPQATYTASFAVNTTVANYLTVTTDFDAANAANLARTEGFVVDIVNPST